MKLSATWKYVLQTYLIVRVFISLIGVLGVSAVPNQGTVSAGGYSKPSYSRPVELIFGIWERADSLWFSHLAQDGYRTDTSDAAFLPLFPWMIRLVSLITFLPEFFSGFLIGNITFLFSLYFLFKLTELDYGKAVAERAIWYQALCPGTVFSMSGFSEGLFLLLAVFSFWAARKGRWWQAGTAGALLGLTRNLGTFIVVPLMIEAYLQWKKKRNSKIPYELAWIGLVPLGILGWMTYWHFYSGDAFKFLHSHDNWQRQFLWPWLTAMGGLKQAWDYLGNYPGGMFFFEALVFLTVLTLAVFSIKKLRLSYSVFLWAYLLIPLLAPYDGRMLMCYVRFATILFPTVILLAVWAKKPLLDQAIKTIFAGLLAVSTILLVANQLNF